MTGALDGLIFGRAWRQTVNLHEILCSKFHLTNGYPAQILLRGEIALREVDLRDEPESQQHARCFHLIEQQLTKPFDLTNGPVAGATLFHLSECEHLFIVVTHRIVCDEVSLQLLLGETYACYQRHLSSGNSQGSQAAAEDHELVSHETHSADFSYWLQRLVNVPSSLDLPVDRPRPPLQTFRGGIEHARIEAAVLQSLRNLGQQQSATLFVTLLAAFNVLLSRYARQEDVIVGTRVSGRMRPELQNVIAPLENMLALRNDLSGDPTFVELLARVQKVVDEAFRHQTVPFETLLRELRLERDMSRHPLFQIMFTMQDAPSSLLAEGVNLVKVENPDELVDLAVELEEQENGLNVTFRYSIDLFDGSTITRMMANFQTLLESAVQNPEIRISRMPLLTEAERHLVIAEWNDTDVSYPTDTPLHVFIEKQVERTPEAVALIYDLQSLTYRQLNERANQLAHYLRRNGVGPDVLVAVCAERSLELVIALLSILKAGGAYVPLDPDYPKDRLELMLWDANPALVLTKEHILGRLPNKIEGLFCLDRDWPLLRSESIENPTATVRGENLAYAIYTSGSTGKPKGVPNVHEGVVNRLLWMQDTYTLTSKDRVLQKTPFSFDVSVWEFFWPLLVGATLVVARPGGHRDSAYLIDLIAKQGITTLHFVPSMLSIFLEAPGLERCRSVRQVFASGEALSFELQQRFFQRLPSELHNLYGPTEASVDVTYWACRPDSPHSIVPIGRPIANTQIYILDPHLQPVPIGVPGELHIGGIGLARGYLNRPELTAEKFIPNPFAQEPGARLYKTGDLARFLPDGNIEYLGRIDFQVKLRGFRIELGEIEAVMGDCCGVLQAAVALREDNPEDKRLVAYLIPKPGETPNLENLRRELKERLPEYMVPSRFVFMEKFPMTTSGKVDRKALPAPDLDQPMTTTVVAPRNSLEYKLASLFAEVLGLPAVGITDNFFELGGHSLLATRLLAKVNEVAGRHIPLSALFRGATVEALAVLLEQDSEIGREPVILEIQHGSGSRLPFFAIVPPGEESLGYAMLARHMGPDQTVFKVQGHSPVTAGKRPYSEQEMHALREEYLAAVRSVQPQGPYCLGGLCDGAHIAEQIVLALEAQGDEVALFAIFDTWVLQHSQRRWLWKVLYYGQRLREVTNLSFLEQLASYKRIAGNKVKHLLGIKPARTDWQEVYWPSNFIPPRFRAPVILFKRPRQPFYYIDDPEMGWGARSEKGVEIHDVDFLHLEILREPHVRVFAEKLANCIARVSQETSARKPDSRFSELAACPPPAEQGS